MKTTVQLGMLAILVEANDYKELVRQAWAIYRLNQAIHQEGLPMEEFMPYAESGADGNEYRGFVHVPTGKRIKLGQQKDGTGGEWFPRPKGSDHYKGLETWNDAGDTSRQLPAHDEKPRVSGKAKGNTRPAGGDGASREAAPESADAGQLITEMMKDLIANKGDAGTLADALGRWEKPLSRLTGSAAETAKNNWSRFDRIRQDLESQMA